MILLEIKIISLYFSSSVFNDITYSKENNSTFKELPEYIIQYRVIAWNNKYICTFLEDLMS